MKNVLYMLLIPSLMAVGPWVLASQPSVSEKTQELLTVLARKAMQQEEIERIGQLITDGADVKAHDKDGVTPVLVAAAGGHAAAVELLIKAEADVNVKNKDGLTPLMGAAGNGRAVVVKQLIGARADINAQDATGQTAVQWAEYGGHGDVVVLLKNA